MEKTTAPLPPWYPQPAAPVVQAARPAVPEQRNEPAPPVPAVAAPAPSAVSARPSVSKTFSITDRCVVALTIVAAVSVVAGSHAAASVQPDGRAPIVFELPPR
jgi:hypothetical protein